MPKKDSCEIIVVLDRSGSMASIKEDMEGGFNTFIDEQRKLPGTATVTLAQFDDEYDIVYQARPLADVPKLQLIPRGWTALLDAVGRTIASVGERLEKTPEGDRPERVLFVVITDGEENRSKEFTNEKVREMVKHQTEKYSWQFVYIGANQDAFASAGAMGIAQAVNYAASAAGVRGMTANLGNSTRNYRSGQGYN